VSENDNCHCAGTTKAAVKVLGSNPWREKPWGDLEKHRGCGRDMLGWGKLLQVRTAATGNARSPTV